MDIFIHKTAVIDSDTVIGEGTKVWAFSHISVGARVGKSCIIDIFF